MQGDDRIIKKRNEYVRVKRINSVESQDKGGGASPRRKLEGLGVNSTGSTMW